MVTCQVYEALFKTSGIVALLLLSQKGFAAGDEAVAEENAGLAVRAVVSPGVQYTNHLAGSKSPYLIQHAHNPVDWYPWGEEAFARARKENKPIFLSVGYSTCHWCHVMAQESFENLEIAKILNDNFVCIKVDREEHPDVDDIYMTFVQATTGGGGWPMNVWLTPDLKPFYGGTYFPPERLKAVLEKLADAWRDDRDHLLASGNSITQKLREIAESPRTTNSVLNKSLLDKAYLQIKSGYEPNFGGFSAAPKFPRPATLNFLLRYYARTGTNDALDMSLFTLRKMADGGIHDQIGGGFHRYSTDLRWQVPHFEKMLYDQAQLACVYLDAYQITHDKLYADIAKDILAYVQSDLTGDQGQFYSAEDADSLLAENSAAHAEGAFYVWREKEIAGALSPESAEVFNYFNGVEKTGNVKDDPRDEFSGGNVLIISHTVAEASNKFHKSPAEIQNILAGARQKLFAVRVKRPHPHLDDNVITAWNGLMISAFARAYQVFDDPQYLASARKSADFIKAKLYDAKAGRLSHCYHSGETAVDGLVGDYAFLTQGLLDLYEADFEITNLAWAFDLQIKQNELFWDSTGNGFFSTTGKDSSLLLRTKTAIDGAEPSANSVAALNLLRLSQMLDEKSFYDLAEKTMVAFGARLDRAPDTLPQMMVALDFSLNKPAQIIIAGKPDSEDIRAMFRIVNADFIPGKIMLCADGGNGQNFLGQHLEFIREIKPEAGKATAFVCQDYVCQRPTLDLATLKEIIKRNHYENR